METQATQAKKPVIFSGIQPSGNLTLGNYIGALRNFKILEDAYDCIYSIVDMHAITVRQDPASLRRRCYEMLALYLAVGLDPKQSIIYCQSHVAAHAELAWILNCYSYIGELQRMTQFKDKSAKQESSINAGLLMYPVLMAADIVLYQTNLVPIGDDQRQHLELARDIAIRFNNLYGDVFAVPEGYIPKAGARIKSLQEPTRKMSKSDPDETFIAILDTPEVIRRKCKRAVTDSEACVRFDVENKPGVSNLMTILSVLSGQSFEAIEGVYAGRGYGDFKQDVAEVVVGALSPIREEHVRLMADKGYLEQVMMDGAERAARLASRTLDKVKKKVGLAPVLRK